MREFSGFRARFGYGTVASTLIAPLLTLCLVGCAGPQARPAPTVAATSAASSSIQTAPMTPVDDLGRARAVAPGVSLRKDAPLRYVVKKGDTLWAIAGYFLRAPWQWPALWYDNPYIHNPHLIYPGDVLKLVWVNGRPRLTEAAGVERLQPHVRESPLQQAAPAIPYAAIRDFLNGPRLVDADEIDKAPYVVAFTDAHLIGAEGDGIFVKHLPSDAAAVWALVHIGKAYHDADSGALLGYEAIPTGRTVLDTPGKPATMRITDSDRETRIGDRLLPITAEDFHAEFVPHAPKGAIDGSIISVFGGLKAVGQHQIVTLDRGGSGGLDAGTVLRIMQAGRMVPDPHGPAGSSVRLPPQPAGLLMVFKVSPHLSYALVMNETRSVHVLDRVAAPGPASQLPRG